MSDFHTMFHWVSKNCEPDWDIFVFADGESSKYTKSTRPRMLSEIEDIAMREGTVICICKDREEGEKVEVAATAFTTNDDKWYSVPAEALDRLIAPQEDEPERIRIGWHEAYPDSPYAGVVSAEQVASSHPQAAMMEYLKTHLPDDSIMQHQSHVLVNSEQYQKLHAQIKDPEKRDATLDLLAAQPSVLRMITVVGIPSKAKGYDLEVCAAVYEKGQWFGLPSATIEEFPHELEPLMFLDGKMRYTNWWDLFPDSPALKPTDE